MNPALFSLIARAGNASLDELRARTPVDESVLTRDLATMLDEGVVALSCEPGPSKEDQNIIQEKFGKFNLDLNTLTILYCIPDLDEQNQVIIDMASDEITKARKAETEEIIKTAIGVAFNNEHVSQCVKVSPTTRGFKIF
jgi:hypothetical protein